MLIDFLWTVLALAVAGVFLYNGRPWEGLMWAGVAQYAFLNWTNNRLRGTKYDY